MVTLTAADQREDDKALAGECSHGLMAEDERWHARPRVTAVAVQVRAADAGQRDPEDDIVGAGLRVLELLVVELRPALPEQAVSSARFRCTRLTPQRRGSHELPVELLAVGIARA